MEFKLLLNSILYAAAIALAVSIIILSFLMNFSCAENIRYFTVFLAISIFCLSLAGIISIKK